METVRCTPWACACTRTPGRSGAMSGRVPVAARSESTMPSLSLRAPKCVCVIAGWRPLNSQASVALRPEVRRPVDAGDAVVEFRRVARLELRHLEVHPVGDARPQAGAVSALEWPGERDSPGALARPERTASGELADQQIREAPGSAREKAQRRRSRRCRRRQCPQDRSSQVVFSSVYFSSACSDLSRPMPDCLKPPKGTVMSSAS